MDGEDVDSHVIEQLPVDYYLKVRKVVVRAAAGMLQQASVRGMGKNKGSSNGKGQK